MTSKRTKAGDALSCLLLATFKLNGGFLESADRISADSGLTGARWQILGSVMRADKPVVQIAREMGLTRQSVQRIANILEKESMVKFAPNPAHQRAKLVVATKKGRDAIDTLAQRQFEWANASSEGFDERDIRKCTALMLEIADRLEHISISKK